MTYLVATSMLIVRLIGAAPFVKTSILILGIVTVVLLSTCISNFWPTCIAIGILTATFSTGVSYLSGSSRILEAISKDQVFASLGIELTGAPNFHPLFKYFTWHTCLFGLLGHVKVGDDDEENKRWLLYVDTASAKARTDKRLFSVDTTGGLGCSKLKR
uniref:Uncharacterized protein n=1 Tax=Glossina palpalis gambiensis TaxID=67801 RepID=A0A1B0BBC6_9MUSC